MKAKLSKRTKPLELIVSGSFAPVECEPVEPGVFLGSLCIAGVNFHVEAVQVEDEEGCEAVNPDFQDKIDCWLDTNEDEKPRLVKVGKRLFFVHAEPPAK